jgi:probable H4MPT-linked C1 transfer pathway protein
VIVLGWDIGGSNTKVCRVENCRVVRSVSRPFEVKDAPDQLVGLLQTLSAEVGHGATIGAHAVTMTAELSRNFLTKREGVTHVTNAVRDAFPPPVPIYLFTSRGALVPIEEGVAARLIASANWMATARLVAESHPDALLIDVGSTTSDIIPIVGGVVRSWGRTDPERLASGELVYTGVLRTPVEGLAHQVGIANLTYGVAAESFATSGDVYVWLGDLMPDAYTGATADGRPSEKHFAGARLRRALCADDDSMPPDGVSMFARALADAQVARLVLAIGQVRSRQPSIQRAVVLGLGAFVARRAAQAAGLEVAHVADGRQDAASACAPAAAVGILLGRELAGRRGGAGEGLPRPLLLEPTAIRRIVKVGGSLLAHPARLRDVLHQILKSRGSLVVPGGGPFADTVRALDPDLGMIDRHTHWMAVLGMDQYAEVLVHHLPSAVRVETLAEARDALRSQKVPVLAPSRWLRHADPLPHSWDVTSDSIAAWTAGEAGASTLVLIKAPGATGQLTDAYFERALPPGVKCEIVPADDRERLDAALGTSTSDLANVFGELHE